VAFEYQYWCTSKSTGVAADLVSTAGPDGGPAGFAATTLASDNHVNLVGFNIGTGLTW